MKMQDVDYLVDVLAATKDSQPLIRDNLTGMKKDFERVFKDTLEMDQPEHIPLEALQGMKTDMLMTFCWGMCEATNRHSSFRTSFNLPKEVIAEMTKKKIITPDNGIKQASKIILP